MRIKKIKSSVCEITVTYQYEGEEPVSVKMDKLEINEINMKLVGLTYDGASQVQYLITGVLIPKEKPRMYDPLIFGASAK